MSEHDTHWTAKAAWMRDVGATDAAWSTEGDLVHCKLGAAPVPVTEEKSQPSSTPQERERQVRLDRRALSERASGGPVPRLDVIG